jgi:hypothetical protein
MEIVIEQTNKIFTKAIKRFAKEHRAESLEVSIIKRLDENDELIYSLGINHTASKTIGFMDILGVKFDVRGYSFFVPPQIKKIIAKFQKEHDTKDVVVCIYLDRDDDDEVNYFLFANDNFIKRFELSDVLDFEFEQINQ